MTDYQNSKQITIKTPHTNLYSRTLGAVVSFSGYKVLRDGMAVEKPKSISLQVLWMSRMKIQFSVVRVLPLQHPKSARTCALLGALLARHPHFKIRKVHS